MCRAWVGINLKSDDEVAREEFQKAALHYMFQSHEKGNTHGYFFAYDDKSGKQTKVYQKRTLKYPEAMDFIAKNTATNVFHGHARIASKGGICDEFVHGWPFKGCTTSHNGTVDIDTKTYGHEKENDSLQFFSVVFDDKVYNKDMDTWLANIKKFCEDGVRGSGVFFITHDKFTIGISINKDITMNIVNNNFMMLNSQNDIHKFDEAPYIRYLSRGEEKVKKGLIEFERNEGKTYDSYFEETDLEIQTNYKAIVEDCIILIDNSNGEVIKQIPLESKRGSFQQDSRYSGGYSKPQTKTFGIKGKDNVTIADMAILSLDELNSTYFDIRKQVEAVDEKDIVEEDDNCCGVPVAGMAQLAADGYI